MSISQLRTFKKDLEQLVEWKGTRAAKDKLAKATYELYDSMGKAAVSQEYEEVYELSDMSTQIFKAALHELNENEEKWEKAQSKENKVTARSPKTHLFELSITHMRNCSQKPIDHNNVPWILYSMKALSNEYLYSEPGMENDIAACLSTCAYKTKLYWVEHRFVKQLWDFIWNRIEDPSMQVATMKNYIDTALMIMEEVELTVFEESPYDLVKKVLRKLRQAAGNKEAAYWGPISRKYPYISVISYVVHRWGIEARDLILREVFEFIPHLLSFISVEQSVAKEDSKRCMMMLTDDLIKLAMVERVGEHRTISEKTEEDVKQLARVAISEALKSASKVYSYKLIFSLPEEYVEYLARWILVLRELDPPSPNNSFEEPVDYKKRDDRRTYALEGLIDLSFGQGLFPNSHKCNAWVGAVQILERVVASRKLSGSEVGRIVVSLWSKRKAFSTDALRSTFCSFLATVVSLKNVRLGYKQVPSIDVILGYSLNLMPSLATIPKSAYLTECILRHRPKEVPEDMLLVICNTVSRTNPTVMSVLRLISALISYTEFDEGSRFCNINDDEKGNWRLRKDIIDWLLSDPGANSHKLIYQLCQYHPVFCFNLEEPICKDTLLRDLKNCGLANSSQDASETSFCPLEAEIGEMVQYVHDELHCKLVSELSLPLFVISYEFSLKTEMEIAGFENILARIPEETNELEDSVFLESVEHFTVWPSKLPLPSKRNSLECVIVYFLTNLGNQLINLKPWLNRKDEIVEDLSRRARRSAVLRSKLQQAMPFNNFVKQVILDNLGDIYETIQKFDNFSFLLSHRNLLAVRSEIEKDASEQVNIGDNISEDDLIIFDKTSKSACIRNVSEKNIIGGYDLDANVVAVYPNHVYFDDRSVIQYLRRLKKSPFLAQSIVRHIITNERLWHLHGVVLKHVARDEKLLSVCIATIPNMVRFLKIYQVLFDPKLNSVQFLRLNADSIAKCRMFLRKPAQNKDSITPDDLITLFGHSQNKWAKIIARFWKLFEKEPALVCEKLHRFAEECVKLGLRHRLVYLLKAISTNEFSRSLLTNEPLQTVYWLIYRSIFCSVVEKECRTDIVEMCCDEKLRYDLFEHRIKTIPVPHADAFGRFETKIAFSVEKFLKNGVEDDDVNFTDFGLVEFYKQLNENLTEDIIRTMESREKYLIDFFSAIWLLHPPMRPQILLIVARFKHVSSAWTQFPQPPHVVANKDTFLFKLRFNLAMEIMTSKRRKIGEISTYTMLLLTTYKTCHYRKDIIPENQMTRLKNETKREVLCILSKVLRKDAYSEDLMNIIVFEAVTQSAALFPNIAACVVPFLFYVCTNVSMKYEDAFSTLMACLKGVDKENQQVVYCLAESYDSLGLDVISRYERVKDEGNPNYSSHWQFVLAKLFVKHGFLNHAFSLANVLFDRFSTNVRNVMMINRISLEDVDKNEELTELLVEIYVAENNSVALSSLPMNVQTRPEVRQVMRKKSKEWLRLVAENVLDKQELTVIRWMCGLKSEDGEQFLDSILRCRFTEYPKIIDSPIKFVYFLLFHLSAGTDISSAIEEVMSQMSAKLSIDEVRLLQLATDMAYFEPHSIKEHVVQAIRYIRETTGRRKRSEMNYLRELNEKTARIVRVTGILAENNAHVAASNLLKNWHEECVAWNSSSVDVALVEICQCDVMCQAGDTRMAEIHLRGMQPRADSMSDVALAEWTLVLSKITLDFRNDLDESVRLLEKGCRRLQRRESVDARLKVLLKFHSVCINQLSKLEEYRESRSFRMKQKAISVLETQIINSAKLARGNSGDEGSKRTVTRIKREHQCEKTDVEKVENSVTTAAQKAVSSAFDALECINQLDDPDEAIRTASLIIFPLIDVIYKYEQCPEVVNLLKEHANTKIISRLWLCATSHIASKCFSTDPSPLRRYLYQILCRLIYDYPHHVLHTVLMYEFEQNGSQVKSFLNSIFDKPAQRDSARLKEIVVSMREAHAAYRELARLKSDSGRFKRGEIDGKSMLIMPADLKIFKCKLNQLPIPIITQKIGRPGDYSTTGLITWLTWKRGFTIADGLSAPKVWEIQGSDGKWYKTVWKLDDVRQDVLVEQMFDVTNNMLDKRELRTYNVVPLDTECGIIEFCGGTISIKEMLCGASRDQGLHQEFNPTEVSANKVSAQMRNVQTESTETRRRVFVEICKSYSPVFRYFFYRNFPTAHIWREKINDYRRSLATWSVVCYIVGLGDRHASNILFDQKMCTFVHIDLGMILEYSKRTLPVPEQVPFRISRDLLDPILVEGIENGQLADDCTNAIEKFKQNRKAILGVASALLRETMTNFRETEQASGRPSYISEMAIGRLRDKLGGTDDGVTAQSSNLQVRRLLREATNADNLSRMFCGWMPYL